MPAGVFTTLPPNFFSPLAWTNKEHYAALLILYYRLFQENSGRLERELVIRSFTEYLCGEAQTPYSVPTEKIEAMVPHMDQINLVIRHDRSAFVRDFHRKEAL